MNKRQIQAEITKKALDDAVSKLLPIKNIDELTIKEICSEANVAVGTFYNYYTSKEELIWDALKLDNEYFINIADEKIINGTLRENLSELAKYYCEYFDLKGTTFIKRVFISKLNSMYENKCEKGALLEIINKLVKKAQENGEISKERSCEEISDFMMASIRGRFIQWCLYEGNYDLYERTMLLIDVMLKGLK